MAAVRSKSRRWLAVFFASSSLVLEHARIFAEDGDLLMFMGGSAQSNMSPPTVSLRVNANRELPQDIRGETGTYARNTDKASASGMAWHDQTTELSLTAGMNISTIQGDNLVFPDGVPLPDRLNDWKAGFLVRQKYSHDRIVTFTSSIGSSTDHPFVSSKDMTLSAAITARLLTRNNNAWLLSLSYSNQRGELNGVPLPGIDYLWNISSQVHAAIGFPFDMLMYRPSQRLDASIFATVLGFGHAGLSIAPIEHYIALRIIAAVDYGGDQYKTNVDSDPKNNIIFRSITYSAGIEYRQGMLAGIQATCGYATRRQIIDGHSISGSTNRVDIANGLVLATSANVRF